MKRPPLLPRQTLGSTLLRLKLLSSCLCVAHPAKLVLSGVCKRDIVARKITVTFSPIGLAAVLLSPVNALYGDLNII